MDLKEHLLVCLAEECGEVKDVLYLDTNNTKKLEYEVNDIISVAHLLHDEDIIISNLEPISGGLSDYYGKDIKHDFNRVLFKIVKDIHYFTCKAIRFGLNDTKPNSTRTNRVEIEFALNQLVFLLKESKSKLNLWDRDKLSAKEEKVKTHCELAIKNNTLQVR